MFFVYDVLDLFAAIISVALAALCLRRVVCPVCVVCGVYCCLLLSLFVRCVLLLARLFVVCVFMLWCALFALFAFIVFRALF